MTGFGRSEAASPYGRFSIVLTGYNHRFCDVFVNLPQNLLALEPTVKAYVAKRAGRGKINVFFDWVGTRGKQRVRIDEELAGSFLGAMRRVKKSLGLNGNIDLNHLLSFPQLVRVEKKEENLGRLSSFVKNALKEAVDSFLAMREKEGDSIYRALRKSIRIIKKELSPIKKCSKSVVERYRKRLSRRLRELGAGKGLDENRLAAEVAILATRADIGEELVRLESFLKDFEDLTGKSGLIGKRLEFILQEMLREANTLGSKMREPVVLQSVVSIKAEIERAKELIQNVA